MKLSCVCFLLALCVVPGLLHAQPQPYKYDPVDIQRKAATFTGGMNFLSEQCGLATPAQLEQLHQKQRQKAVESGLPGAEFDQLYSISRTETSRIWEPAPEEEKRKTCQDVKQLMGSSV